MKQQHKLHTTNYSDTFIVVTDDCKVSAGEIPKTRNAKKTIACMQFELISKNPYTYTSDDILFQIFAERNDLTKSEYEHARQAFFSKGQACLRASPLTKKYGWGLHCDKLGKLRSTAWNPKNIKNLLMTQKLKKPRPCAARKDRL